MELKKLTSKERASLEEVSTIVPLTTSNLKVSISTEISLGNLILSGKKIEILRFNTGGDALIIDGVLYKFEIMAYHFDESTNTDTNLTMTDLGIHFADLNGADIEQIEDEDEE